MRLRRKFAFCPAKHGRTVLLAAPLLLVSVLAVGAQSSSPTTPSSPAAPQAPAASRGEKLMLKDGSFQLVREYKVEGDRVRYYSIDRSQWEEIPSALVDWDKTKQVEADQAKYEASIVTKVHHQEEGRLVQPLDIDASLEAAPGIFLPPGQGVFALDGKVVLPIASAEPTFKTSKKREIERVLTPIPIVSSRHFVLIAGTHAKLRLKTSQPEFYMRTTQEGDPELELVTAQVEKGSRKIARVDELLREQQATARDLPLQRWEVAKGVYRFTLGQTLDPGEYALIQVVPQKTEGDQLSIFVWDFGVDRPTAAANPSSH